MYIYEGCTLAEVQAMRDLQDEPFDFGSGLIIPDCKESEDTYFEMALECGISDYDLLVNSIFCDQSQEDFMNDIYLEMEYDDLTSTKDMTRAKRRKNNWKKAIYKRDNGYFEDKPLNSFNKGKNFCSCSCCTIKTNSKGKTYFGKTKIPYATRNWKASDQRNIDRCDYGLNEHLNGNSFDFWEEYWMWEAHDETDIQLREDDQDILLDYVFTTKDDIVFYDGRLEYQENQEEWARRVNWGTIRWHNE